MKIVYFSPEDDTTPVFTLLGAVAIPSDQDIVTFPDDRDYEVTFSRLEYQTQEDGSVEEVLNVFGYWSEDQAPEEETAE